jgi:hypothetical protein
MGAGSAMALFGAAFSAPVIHCSNWKNRSIYFLQFFFQFLISPNNRHPELRQRGRALLSARVGVRDLVLVSPAECVVTSQTDETSFSYLAV